MIRKAVIVVLTLGAVATCVLWIDSYRFRRTSGLNLFTHNVVTVGVVGIEEGGYCNLGDRRRVGASTSEGVLSIRYEFDFVDFQHTPPKEFGLPGLRYQQWFFSPWDSPPPENAARVRWVVREVKITFAMILAILLAYPTIAFIRGPFKRWRRRRRGECVACGYNLTGNVTGVCSECGTKIDEP